MPFKNLIKNQEAERIILIVRRHWFNVFQQMITVFLMVLLLFASYAYLPLLFPALNRAAYSALFLFAENLFAMIIWMIFFLILIDYYFDVWIITDKRIVNAEQKGLFAREVSEVSLEKIQDISTEVLGVIPTFLNYGDVQIQTAAEEEKFLFRKVSDPYRIKDIIMQLQKLKQSGDTQELGEIIQQKINGSLKTKG